MKLYKINRMIFKTFYFGILVLMISCAGTRNPGTVNNYDELINLVKSRKFEIESEWVNPLGGNRVYMTPGSNYIKFQEDSVEVFLPYFGVRHSGGYGSDGGIIYEGPTKEFKIKEETQKEKLTLYFRGNHEGEDLQFYVTLFSTGKANVSVNSSQRSSVSYQGEIISSNKEKE